MRYLTELPLRDACVVAARSNGGWDGAARLLHRITPVLGCPAVPSLAAGHAVFAGIGPGDAQSGADGTDRCDQCPLYVVALRRASEPSCCA
jgi:hypothetical protein